MFSFFHMNIKPWHLVFLKLFSSFLYFSILRKPSRSSWHHFIPLCEAYISFIHSYSLVLIHERNDISCAGCNHSCQYNCLTTFQGQTVPICSQSVTKTSFSWIAFNQKREPGVCSMLCGNCNEARRNSKEQNRGRCRLCFTHFSLLYNQVTSRVMIQQRIIKTGINMKTITLLLSPSGVMILLGIITNTLTRRKGEVGFSVRLRRLRAFLIVRRWTGP